MVVAVSMGDDRSGWPWKRESEIERREREIEERESEEQDDDMTFY